MKSCLAVIAISTSILLAGCGSKDLDRPLAEKILKENKVILALQENITLNQNADSVGQRLRWWKRLRDGFSKQALDGGLNKDFITLQFGSGIQAKLATPAQMDVTVTGIIKSDGGVTSIGEFSWSYRNLNPKIAYVAIEGGRGKAIFQRYDDGWRISEFLSLNHSQSPYALSSSQAQELEAEVARIEAQERIAIANEAQERIKRIANAARLIVGTWNSSSRMGTVRMRFKEDGSYEQLSNHENVVMANGRWSIDKNRIEMKEIEKLGMNGRMWPSNSEPWTNTILDISDGSYVVEQSVTYAGGTSGKELWNSVRIK